MQTSYFIKDSPCSVELLRAMPDIELNINNMSVFFQPKHYAYNESGNCNLGIRVLYSTWYTGGDYFIPGKLFLMDNYAIFDYENGRFGTIPLYRPIGIPNEPEINPDEPEIEIKQENDIIPIWAIISGGVIIVIITFVVVVSCCKRKKIDLESYRHFEINS